MKDKLVRLLSIGAILVALGFWFRGTSGEQISGAAARTLVKEGALLVDVRTSEEFADGHIDGAINIPVSQLDARLAEVGAKTRPVVVYCFSGARSRRAADALRTAGFTKVHDLGGMSRWNQQP